MKTLLMRTLALLLLLSSGVLFDQNLSEAAPAKAENSANTASSKSTPNPVQKSGQKLKRADFRVKGASCVACLRRVGKIMREQKGVLKADVSIFPPYWAIAIFDGNQTNMDKIFEAVKEEKVNFLEIEEKEISTLPMIIIPRSGSKQESATNEAASK